VIGQLQDVIIALGHKENVLGMAFNFSGQIVMMGGGENVILLSIDLQQHFQSRFTMANTF
jgi:hypothetical protein